MLIFLFFFNNVEILMYNIRVSKIFTFSIFEEKITIKTSSKYDFEFFFVHKVDFTILQKSSRFYKIYPYYQSKKSLFFRFSTHFPHSWRVEISLFSIIFPIVQTQTPPSVLLRKRQKVPKFYIWVFRQKLEKHDYQSQNRFYQNFRKNTYLWGVWRKFSKICPSFKG